MSFPRRRSEEERSVPHSLMGLCCSAFPWAEVVLLVAALFLAALLVAPAHLYTVICTQTAHSRMPEQETRDKTLTLIALFCLLAIFLK